MARRKEYTSRNTSIPTQHLKRENPKRGVAKISKIELNIDRYGKKMREIRRRSQNQIVSTTFVNKI